MPDAPQPLGPALLNSEISEGPSPEAAEEAGSTEARRWWQRTNGLPRSVALAYFLIAWAESFPMTAFTALLTDDLGMSLSTISTYYAVTFLPFMWKPAFGWLSDTVPLRGFHRLPYIFLSSLGCVAGFLLFAFWVRSQWQAFVTAMLLQSCLAFLQLMVGGFVVDLARKDTDSSAALQSVLNAAQWLGTFLAQVTSLAFFAQGRTDAMARPALALTALAPALVAVVTPFLPEQRATPRPGASGGVTAAGARFAATVVLLQANLILVGCQPLMAPANWRFAVAVTFVASTCMLVALYLPVNRAAVVEAIVEPGQKDASWWVRLCLFCFSVNAIPRSGVAMGQFQYAVFSTGSYQALGLVSSLASMAASLVFGRAFSRRKLPGMIAASTVFSSVMALAPLPFAAAAMGYVGVQKLELWSLAGILGVSATLLNAFATLFTVLPVDTLVTSASGSVGVDRSCTAYAAFLACYNFGATVSGLVTAPILESIGLTQGEWGPLPAWIAATAAARLLIVPLLALLPTAPTHRSRENSAGSA